jgi:hypothetical protein
LAYDSLFLPYDRLFLAYMMVYFDVHHLHSASMADAAAVYAAAVDIRSFNSVLSAYKTMAGSSSILIAVL